MVTSWPISHVQQTCRTSTELKSQDTEELSSPANSKRMISPVSDGSRNSMDRINGSDISSTPSNGSSKRITETSSGSGRKQSKRIDSFREEERVIKIEES